MIETSTFGFHCYGPGKLSNTIHSIKASKLSKLTLKTAVVAFIALGIAGILGAPIIAGAITIGAIIAIGCAIYARRNICKTAGIIYDNEEVKKHESAQKSIKAEALPTENSTDTELWRKKLIASAKDHIILSGNYCGGKSFMEFLDLIEEKFKERPEIKVVIISSPKFLTSKIKERLQALKKEHPNHFSVVESPDIWHFAPGIKKSTNHTKCMIIDYGKYFILGGSGIKDNFTKPGLERLSKSQYLEQKHIKEKIEADSKEEPSNDPYNTFIDKILPGSFRDMDFVFKASKQEGHIIYTQALLLAHRWEQLNELNKLNSYSHLFASSLSKTEQLSQTLVAKMLREPIPETGGDATTVDEFDSSDRRGSADVKIVSSGPEHFKSCYKKEILKAINEAKERIVINHMYFHPSKDVLTALSDAAKRGVKIKIISCGIFPNCPSSHLFFGPRNKANYLKLFNSLNEEQKKNVEVFEFQQRKIGNHKKAIIIDDLVIAGSSNFGYKSLETASDHEINFIAKSAKLAEETLKIFDVDLAHSAPFDPRSKLSFKEKFSSFFHEITAPLYG